MLSFFQHNPRIPVWSSGRASGQRQVGHPIRIVLLYHNLSLSRALTEAVGRDGKSGGMDKDGTGQG